MEALPVSMRLFRPADMDAVQVVEEACFEYESWRPADFDHENKRTSVVFLVAEADRHLVGYIMYDMKKSRIEVLSFAVHPQVRRRLVGHQMFQHIAKKLRPGRREMLCEVTDQTLGTHLFLRSLGFRGVKVNRRQGFDGYLFRFEQEVERVLA